jgi:hypothetical protein
MIAVLSLFASLSIKTGLLHYILIFEIMFYVVVTIGLLRFIRLIGPESGYATTSDEYNLRIVAESCSRRRLYISLLLGTVYVTITFLAVVVTHYAI